MKIHFTNKEYMSLLELTFLGEWMTESDNNQDNDHHKLIQKIYAHAGQMNADKFIEYSKKMDEYHPTKRFEDESKVFKYIDAYDENCFWQEFIGRMARRDFEQIINYEDLSQDERFKLLCEFEDKWAEEIHANGLTKLKVKD